jgi:nucleoside-diphosphate-sugar epimerase
MLPGDRRRPGTAPGQSQVPLRKECIMSVSVTGAAEFTGSAIICELPGAGHQVPGLAASGGAALPSAAAGAGGHRGTPDQSGTPAEIAADLA